MAAGRYPSGSVRAGLAEMDWVAVRDVPPQFESDVLRAEEAFFDAQRRLDAAAYDRAVVAWHEVLDSLDADATDQFRADALNRAAVAHWFRGSIRHDMGDFEIAIDCLESALVFASRPVDRARFTHNIAAIHFERYLWAGDPGELDAAIDGSRIAIQLGARSRKRIMFMLHLAQELASRHDLQGSLEDLEEGIRIGRRAQRLAPGSALYVVSLGIVGTLLRSRFVRSRSRRDINTAIRLLDEAVASTPEDDRRTRAAAAVRLTNLGNALLGRYELGGDRADLQRAIEVQVRSVGLTDPAERQYPHRQNNLGNTLLAGFGATSDRQFLDAALQAYTEALAFTPDGAPEAPSRRYNLGNALVARLRVANIRGDVARARRAYREAALGIDESPEWALASSRAWGSWAASRHAWTEAAEASDHGLRAMTRLFRTQLTRESKETWLADTHGLPSRAAYAKAKAGDPRGAVEAAETARALLLSEALERDRADLDHVIDAGHADLAERYRAGAARLDALSGSARDDDRGSTGAPRIEELRAAQRELDATIASIRMVPGFGSFLAPPTFHDIESEVGEAPLVYVGAAELGGVALIVRPRTGVEPVWLVGLTEEALAARVARYRFRYEAYTRSARSRSDRSRWDRAIDDVTGWLGTDVMSPILRRLRGSSTATLIPGGLLGVLPLHAAWVASTSGRRRRYALDDLAIAYVANARTLASARKLAGSISGEHLVAVDEPAIGTDARLPRLPFSSAEVGIARSAFPDQTVLAGAGATRTAVTEAMGHAQYLHLSCHGRADPSNPMNSALAMAGGVPLTLREIMDRPMRARLAVLSACETAIPGEELPDEVVGFTSGFMQAGAAAALATLWSVPNLGTALLMTRFYEAWRVEGHTPPEALRVAQIWLRDTTNREKASHLEALLPSTGHPLASASTEALFRALVLDPNADPAATDHATPYNWAAFSYVGV